jgi:hypothetical protein
MTTALILFLIAAFNFGYAQEPTSTIIEGTGELKALFEGTALNRKGGAVIDVHGEHYWIDGMDSWDDKYRDKMVVVTGQVGTER